ncbi:MAG: putative porin, partial [Tannerellaceae bacterium]
MKYLVYILAFTLCTAVVAEAQRPAEGGRKGQQTRSPFRTLSSPNDVPDSLMNNTQTDSIKRITAFRLSERLGEVSIAPMDTSRLNFGQSAQMEANGLAIGYLGPLGSPSQSKVFIERGEGQDFIFANDFNYFSIYPDSMLYYNAKLPYTNIMYTQNGANVTREERLKGV